MSQEEISVEIEYSTRTSFSSREDEKKYIYYFDQCKEVIEDENPGVTVQANVKNAQKWSFEITVNGLCVFSKIES